MSLIAAKWTIGEYHQMISSRILENRRVELLKGEIVEMSPSGEPHAYFSTEAGAYLIRLLGARAAVRSGKPIALALHKTYPKTTRSGVQMGIFVKQLSYSFSPSRWRLRFQVEEAGRNS